MRKEINVRLNANRATAIHTGHKFASGDKGIVFRIAVDELDTTGTTAKIVFKRSNGTSVEAGISETEGIYSYTTLGNEFAVVGPVVADVKFYEGENRVSTCTFVFEVTSDTLDGLAVGAAGYSDTLERIKTGMEETEQEMNALTDELQELYEDYTAAFGNVAPFNPRGPYSDAEDYEVRDLVTHDNASWVCYKNCTGVTPGEDSDCWQKLVSEGVGGGDADTLGGHEAEYFSTKERERKIQTVSGATFNAVGWYRVAEYLTNGAENISNGALANSVMLFIKRNHQNIQNEQHLLLLESIRGKQNFVSLSSKSNTQLVTKARYTYNLEEGKAYIEVYYNGTLPNFCNFEISHTDRDEEGAPNGKYLWYAIEPKLTEETVEGVTVTATYDIPANATLVTDLVLAGYFKNTGGTIYADNAFPVSLRNMNGESAYFQFAGKSGNFGALGFLGVDKPVVVNSKSTTVKELLHTGNKPTGTYTGNGDATTRTIAIGSIGKVFAVRQQGSTNFAIVTQSGYIGKQGNTVVCGTDAFADGGNLAIQSTSQLFNTSGSVYDYYSL